MEGQRQEAIHKCSCSLCRTQGHADVVEYHEAINRVVVKLDERGRRLFAGLMAKQLGRGGIQRLAEITGLNRMTIRRGLREILQGDRHTAGRVRRRGGGRPAAEKKVLGC